MRSICARRSHLCRRFRGVRLPMSSDVLCEAESQARDDGLPSSNGTSQQRSYKQKTCRRLRITSGPGFDLLRSVSFLRLSHYSVKRDVCIREVGRSFLFKRGVSLECSGYLLLEGQRLGSLFESTPRPRERALRGGGSAPWQRPRVHPETPREGKAAQQPESSFPHEKPSLLEDHQEAPGG